MFHAAHAALDLPDIGAAEERMSEGRLRALRDHAERARTAVGLRGIDLDDQSDRVTAQEWLDAHLAEQRATEPEREITEDDLIEDDLRRDDEPAVMPTDQQPDIADDHTARSGPAPTERAEQVRQRRVPPPDAATAAFDRAQEVLREVAARQQAEQAAAAQAAELESAASALAATSSGFTSVPPASPAGP